MSKRIFDFLLSLFGIVISWPLWILCGFLIWLEDGGGPIFFVQERIGKGGIFFKSIKFRSMVRHIDKKDEFAQAGEHDKRVTGVGRFLRRTAMDELPQLINILKGEMSFVGPRPLRQFEIDNEDDRPRDVREFPGFRERIQVRPGLTGIAQILAPRDISRIEKFKYDIWYIKNQSFWLDSRIIAKSFLVSFMGRWETRRDKFKHLTRYHLEQKP